MITPTMTSQVWPPSMRRPEDRELAMKPLVSGMPAKASRRNVKTPANSGERRPRPGPAGQVGGLAVGVADQGDARANAAITVKPYATR